MPINAITGLMGSGKSFECVSSVIIPAVRSGRRIVTNVDGIDSEAIRCYCFEKFSIPLDQLGFVVHCTNDQVFEADFFPHGSDTQTFVQPGDLVCIDEAWRFWGTDSKIIKEHRIFFREHRHYVHPDTKVCCDLVLMVQDIGDLNRLLKAVVELSFRTTKIKSLGLSKVYRVEMWEGWKQAIKTRSMVQNKKYDPEIFPLYSSYTGGTGKELTVDKRQNVLASPKVWIMFLLVVVLGSVSIFFASKVFSPKGKSSEPDKQVSASSQSSPKQPQIVFSDQWRISGTVNLKNGLYVVLINQNGNIRYEHPSNFTFEGRLMIGTVDGQKVSYFSGSNVQANFGEVKK